MGWPVFFIGIQPVENVDIRNELLIHYLFHHLEAGLIGYALDFSLKDWYHIILHIGAIKIRLAADSGCRQHQLAFSHTVLLSVNGIDYMGRISVSLVHCDRRGGAGVSWKDGWLRTIHHTNHRGKVVWKDELGGLRIWKDEIGWLRV